MLRASIRPVRRGGYVTAREGLGEGPSRRLHRQPKETGSMNLKPLGDRVVVEREEAKGTTAGGIVLPDTAKDKPQKGKGTWPSAMAV